MIRLLIGVILLFRMPSIAPFIDDCKFIKMISDSSLLEVEKIVTRYFPNYMIRDKSELSNYAEVYFMDRYKNCNPSITEGDMDGNGLIDYALILRNRVDNKIVFVILIQNDKNNFQILYQKDLGSSGSEIFLRVIEPGEKISQTESFDIPKKETTLENTGVELIVFEAAAIAYYWDKMSKSIQMIWTDD